MDTRKIQKGGTWQGEQAKSGFKRWLSLVVYWSMKQYMANYLPMPSSVAEDSDARFRKYYICRLVGRAWDPCKAFAAREKPWNLCRAAHASEYRGVRLVRNREVCRRKYDGGATHQGPTEGQQKMAEEGWGGRADEMDDLLHLEFRSDELGRSSAWSLMWWWWWWAWPAGDSEDLLGEARLAGGLAMIILPSLPSIIARETFMLCWPPCEAPATASYYHCCYFYYCSTAITIPISFAF